MKETPAKRVSKRVKATPETPAQTQLLTAQQVMTWLGVSRTALWLLMRHQGLPYVKFGKSRRSALRFSADSVKQWIAQNEYQATA
jgi:predicted DNA-binding transcriptional regulator AlpA